MLLVAILIAALADPLASAQQGARIVERALEAHGANDPEVSLTIRADQVSEGQSLTALAPFETYPYSMEVTLDPGSKRLRVVTQSAIAGDFAFGDVLALQDGKGFSLTPEVKTWREVTSEPPVLNRWLPHRLLKQVLTNRAALRAVDANTVTTGTQTLFFDPKTGLLTRVQQVMPTGYGDATRDTHYEEYKRVGDALLPSRVRVRMNSTVHRTVENVFRYDNVRPTAEFAATDFTVPEGYAKPDYSYRGQFEVKTLADGVWLLENVTRTTGQWSYNVLAVAFDDFVLVAEAPVGSDTSERVLEKLRELAPGKPVRYLVQSHHHNDHIGGIRAYVAEGTTILTGATSKPLIEKIAAAPFVLDPDRLQRSPRKSQIEVIEQRRTITDGKREAVVLNIGPNPHAKDMLIVHLPKEKILWQSDMINEGEYPANAATRDFWEKVKGLEFERIVGLHGKERAAGLNEERRTQNEELRKE